MSTLQNISGHPAPMPEPAMQARPPQAPGSGPAAQVVGQAAAAEPAAPKVQFDPKKMQASLTEAVDRLNSMMEKQRRGLGFSIDDRLNMTVVTVKDTNTGEVVRQIPGEAVLRVAHRIEDLKGILYSKDA